MRFVKMGEKSNFRQNKFSFCEFTIVTATTKGSRALGEKRLLRSLAMRLLRHGCYDTARHGTAAKKHRLCDWTATDANLHLTNSRLYAARF